MRRKLIRSVEKAKEALINSNEGYVWQWHSDFSITLNAEKNSTIIAYPTFGKLVSDGVLRYCTKLRNDVGDAYADLYKITI